MDNVHDNSKKDLNNQNLNNAQDISRKDLHNQNLNNAQDISRKDLHNQNLNNAQGSDIKNIPEQIHKYRIEQEQEKKQKQEQNRERELKQARNNFEERIKRQIKEAYLNRQDNPKIFLSVNRNALEMIVNDILEVFISELSPDHKDRQLKKQPLDSIISVLQKRDILPSHVSAYMHIIRICGNYGTHDQEGKFEESFPAIQDEAMQQLLKWYTGSYLNVKFEFNSVIGDVSRTRFIIHENTSQREKRKKNLVLRILSFILRPFQRVLSLLLSGFQSVIISLLIIAVVYVVLHVFGVVKLPATIGNYVDKFLNLKR